MALTKRFTPETLSFNVESVRKRGLTLREYARNQHNKCHDRIIKTYETVGEPLDPRNTNSREMRVFKVVAE